MQGNWLLFIIFLIIAVAIVAYQKNNFQKKALSAYFGVFFMLWFLILIVLNTIKYGDLWSWNFEKK